MGIDGKYGRVTTERGTIGVDEPVVVFRAQDRLLPNVMLVYAGLCAEAGSPAHHIEAINRSREAVRDWQAVNAAKTPSSDMLAPGGEALMSQPAQASAVRDLARDVADALMTELDDSALRRVFESLDGLWTAPGGLLRSDAPYGAGTFMLALTDVLPGEAVTRAHAAPIESGEDEGGTPMEWVAAPDDGDDERPGGAHAAVVAVLKDFSWHNFGLDEVGDTASDEWAHDLAGEILAALTKWRFDDGSAR